MRGFACGCLALALTMALSLLSGCGDRDRGIAKNDLREIYQYRKQNNLKDTEKYFDKKRAKNLWAWERAAKKEIPEGQLLIGVCYLEGNGIDKAEATGEEWIRKAAENELLEAQLELVRLYSGGNVPGCKEEARKWLIKAWPRINKKLIKTLDEIEDWENNPDLLDIVRIGKFGKIGEDEASAK